MDTSLITAFVLAETLFDDNAEEHRDLRDLVLPLLLCSCLGATQQTQAGAQAAAWSGNLTAYGNRGEQQHVADALLLLLSLLPRKSAPIRRPLAQTNSKRR